MNRIIATFGTLLIVSIGPRAASAYDISADSIQKHINVLADDSLEGRQVGEPGEKKAAHYIESIFRNAGLHPGGDDGSYLQHFDFVKEINFGANNHLRIDNIDLDLNEDFVPLKQSASETFQLDDPVFVDFGIKTGDSPSDYNDYAGKDVAGKAVIIKRFAPSSEVNPHIDFNAYSSITDKIRMAMDQKAAAIIFLTPADEADTVADQSASFISGKDIPIILLRHKGVEKLGLDIDHPEIHSILGTVELVRTRGAGENVVGILPGATDTAIILGAHFDHLGWGGPTSLYRGKTPMIHNGADDNSSGTSTLLELVRYFSALEHPCHHTLIFAAFSGEEAGLLGSSHMAKATSFDPGTVQMMLNMDMIGRLKDQKNELAVMGVGSCTEFNTYFDSLEIEDLNLVMKQSGVTPSDNTMFYNRGIPSVMLFTGAHSDYHRPSDDADKIDAPGIVKVARLVESTVAHFDPMGALDFQKTKDPEESGQRRRFTVSLGVMPDYVAEVKGLKIDGVTPERPAAVAGIQQGDILIQMGDYLIGDIYEYMSALGKFRKGDRCAVRYVRDTDTLSTTVVF